MLMTFMMTIDVCTFIFIFRLRVCLCVCVWMDGLLRLRMSICVCVYYCFCSLYLLHHLMYVCVGINVGLFDRNRAICQQIPKNALAENWAQWTRTMNYAHSNVLLHCRFFHTFSAEWIAENISEMMIPYSNIPIRFRKIPPIHNVLCENIETM